MKKKDFREIDKEGYLEIINDIIEYDGDCFNAVDHCDSCPFNKENAINDLDCIGNGYISNLSPDEADILLLDNAKKFKRMILRERKKIIREVDYEI